MSDNINLEIQTTNNIKKIIPSEKSKCKRIHVIQLTLEDISRKLKEFEKAKEYKKMSKFSKKLLKSKKYHNYKFLLNFCIAISLFKLGRIRKSLKICTKILNDEKEISNTNPNYRRFLCEGALNLTSTSFLQFITQIIELKSIQYTITNEDYKTYIKCLIILSNYPELDGAYAKIRLGHVYNQLEMPEKAAEEYKQVLRIYPKLFFNMFKHCKLRVKHFKDLSKTNLNNYAIIYAELGNILKEKIKPSDKADASVLTAEFNNINTPVPASIVQSCIKIYNESLKIMPNVQVLLSLCEIYRMIDKPKEALNLIDNAMKLNDKDYRIYYEGFLTYEEIGDFHTAKEMIRICLMLNRTFIKAYNALGNLMRKDKMYEAAVDLFETALMIEPDNVHILNNYATCFLEMGNIYKAKEIYLKAYYLNSDLYEVNCNLSVIYRKEYNYEKAIYHVNKARYCRSTTQVYNILTSIYIDTGLFDLAISSCVKSLYYDPNNCTTLLQLAQCYKSTKNYSESISISMNLLSSNPKFTEAFINYTECQIYTNEWVHLNENKVNINKLADYHKDINNISSNLSYIIADILVSDLSAQFWINEMNSNQEVLNAKYLLDEKYCSSETSATNSYSIPKSTKMKIGYLIEEINEPFTFDLTYKILSFHLREKMNNDNEFNSDFYFIIFHSSDDIDYNYEENFTSTCSSGTYSKNFSNYYINLSDIENPKSKADYLHKIQFDILIYLENLSYNFYDNLNIKKIYQTLVIKPAKIQIILPFNACTRGTTIFDYCITDRFIFYNQSRKLFKEKLIIMQESCLFCGDPYSNNICNAKLDPFIKLKARGIKILANFSQCYKIDRDIFISWCNILKAYPNCVFALKSSNEHSERNLKTFAKNQGVDDNRFIFLSFQENKYDTADCIQYIDLYMDVKVFNGDFEIFFCIFKGIPVVSLNELDINNRITSAMSNSIMSRLDKYSQNIQNNLAEYEKFAIDYLSRNLNRHREDRDTNYKLENYNIDNCIKFARLIEIASTQIKTDIFNNSNIDIICG